MLAPVVDLPLRSVAVRFRARAAGRWPDFPGSAWHGGFGWALRRLVCVTRAPRCAGCDLGPGCPYPRLFEAVSGDGGSLVRNDGALPLGSPPLVIRAAAKPVPSLDTGEEVALRIVLAGTARHDVGYVRRALVEAAARGIGPDRTKLDLASWHDVPSDGAPLPSAGAARLHLHTPLRLRVQGRLIQPEALTPKDVLMALVRRVSVLASTHGGSPVQTDFKALKDRAQTLRWQAASFDWREVIRYSSRQGEVMRMGGIIGEAVVAVDELAPFAPFLALMPDLGIGKGASMGFGHATLEPVA